MAGPISMSFSNGLTLPEIDLQRNSYYHYDDVPGVATLSQAPVETLKGGGITSMIMNESVLSDFQQGFISIACGWTAPNNIPWGLKICVPYQLLGVGDRPYYQTAYGTDEPNWETPVDDPSKPYTFPDDLGYQVSCTPYSEHTSLTINVIINAL